MRVLMLDNEFPPLGGGMGTTNEALLWQFASCPDMTIDLITSALGRVFETVQFAERICLYKVPVRNQNIHHSSNRELIQYAWQAAHLARVLQQTQPYDLCLAWSALPAGVVARYLQLRTGLPYMIWASGPDIPGFEQRYRRLYPFLKPLLRWAWRSARPLIAKCAEEIDLIHATDPGVSVTLIPNGVDLDRFTPGTAKPVDRPLRVICAARLIERKGQHHLIEAVKRLADEQLRIDVKLVGAGDAMAAFQRLAQSLGVDDRVQFVGYVPREQIAQYYAAADVFVLPSFFEGLSLAALEALASGLPLVLTRTGGTSELIEEGVNGLTFTWGNVEQLTAHLKYLALNRSVAHQMGLASRARATRFGWGAIATTYLNLFEATATQS